MPQFDGTGPRGKGPMTGRGIGYCVVPIENISGYRKPDLSYANTHTAQQRPSGIRSYGPNQSGSLPSRFPLRGGRGLRLGARGHFFGRGRGFGRRW
ncbi:MAG: DUF5320 domain-containing protein [Desulfobacteraceae bacterium]|nr:DUF5320 domain-containing protein [Desulfobacteraceae bacterium]